jgi:hypothetical protein
MLVHPHLDHDLFGVGAASAYDAADGYRKAEHEGSEAVQDGRHCGSPRLGSSSFRQRRKRHAAHRSLLSFPRKRESRRQPTVAASLDSRLRGNDEDRLPSFRFRRSSF